MVEIGLIEVAIGVGGFVFGYVMGQMNGKKSINYGSSQGAGKGSRVAGGDQANETGKIQK